MTKWLLLAGLLAVAVVSNLLLGVRTLSLTEIWSGLTAFDPTNPAHVALIDLRVPRVVAGAFCGAAFAAAGMSMQTLTRNPLADPGILGVNAGAAFMVTLGTLIMGQAGAGLLALLAFPGAGIAAVVAYALGGGFRGEANPLRLTLAGVALSALLVSLVTAIVLIRGDSLEVLRFWIVGSLAEARARPILDMTLAGLAGLGLVLALAPRLEVLSLGDDLSRGLGVSPWVLQTGTLAAITLMSGAAVALAGPIAFLGLIVPPVARRLAGAGLRSGILMSAFLGAILLLFADLAGRFILAPAEVRVGIMTAIIGGPVFVLTVRRLRPGAPS